MKLMLLHRSCRVASVFIAGVSLFLAGSTPGQSAAPQARIVESIRNDKLVTLPGNAHAQMRNTTDNGALPDQQQVTRMHLLLQRSPAQETALQKLMTEQLTPGSPNYHAWLTPQQFGQQFGPADSDVQAVKDWLTSQGFTGLRVNNGKTMIEFNGTAGQVRNAFHTELHSLLVNGEKHAANMQDPKIPAALAPVVAGIAGLHNFHPHSLTRRVGKFRRNDATGELTPLFTYTNVDETGAFYGLGPADFAKIYNVPSTTANSRGESIAIVAQSNINLNDLAAYRSIFGLPTLNTDCSTTPYICVVVNGPDPGLVPFAVSDDEGESDLDTQISGAVWPNLNIIFVTSLLTETDGLGGVDASAEYIVDNNLAAVISDSYGSCEIGPNGLGTAGNLFYGTLWQQASAQGQSVVVAAGDEGPAACDSGNEATQGIAVSGIASTPYNVAMGGTDFNQAGMQSKFWSATNNASEESADGYIPEIPWNDSCAATGLTACTGLVSTSPLLVVAAGSGGPSAVYSKPSWQSGVLGIPGDGKRDMPDLSLFSSDGGPVDSTGAPTIRSFYIVCQSDLDIVGDNGCSLTKLVALTNCDQGIMCRHDFQGVGGTSAAAPAFAAVLALINQKTGQRQGNPNVELYALAKAESFGSCASSSIPLGGSATCVFNDITTGNNAVPCTGNSLNCSATTASAIGVLQSGAPEQTSVLPAFTATVGYDLATGLGSVNVGNLISKWVTAGFSGSTVSINSPGAITGTVGSSFTVKGSVTPSTATGLVVLENGSTSAPIGNPRDINIVTTGAGGPANVSNGSWSVSTAFLPAGNYTLKAHYGGDTTFGPSDSGTINVTLAQQTPQVLVSFVNAAGALVTGSQNVQYGSNYILRVDVTNSSGTPCQNATTGVVSFICPTGTVALLDGGKALNDFPNAQTVGVSNVANLNDRGFIEDQPIQLSVGSHTITATYTAAAGSSYTSQPNSNSIPITITQATTTTGVTSNLSVVTSGGSVTLTAMVSTQSNSLQGPTGTVQFLNGSSNLGSAATCTPTGANDNVTPIVPASCTATLTTSLASLPPGFFDPQPRGTPFLPLAWLAAVLAILSFFLAAKLAGRRRQFSYAGLVLLLLSAAVFAGCGGGSSGGGGGGGSNVSISGKYSGDGNYSGSTSSAITITIN